MPVENLLHTFFCLAGAFLLGGLIGFERQWRQRMAGLRTNTLVALGAAAFILFSSLFPDDENPTRIAAQIVSGIGFLGAGIIFKEGLNVRGLNTAATLWCSAAIGTMCGGGFFIHALIVTAFIIVVNAFLRPLVALIERQPFSQTELSPVYAISIVCQEKAEAHIRALLLRDIGENLHMRALESSNIENTGHVEVKANVRANGRQDRLLEGIIGRLSLEPRIIAARWRIEGEE